MYLDKTAELKVRKRSKSRTYENVAGLLMSIIPVLGFFVFGLIPMILAIYMSFCVIDGFSLEGAEFVWFANYKATLTDPMFWKAVGRTFFYALALPICMVISLLVSFLLTKNVKGKKAFRTIFFIPYVCSIVAVVLMWQWIFNMNYGVLNSWLGRNGENAINWLGASKGFKTVVIIMGVWGGCGYQIILFSAALTNVNPTLYEAAKIDGANPIQSFFHVTFPSISPTTFYLLITGLIGSLQAFANTQVLAADGGPDSVGVTIGFYLYRYAFSYFKMGQASATAWVLAIFIMIITILNFTLSKKWVNYDQ